MVTIAVDTSGSVSPFKDDLEKCIIAAINSCKYSPRADNLMVRLVEFNDKVSEVHGFKLLSEVNTADYTGSLNVGGMVYKGSGMVKLMAS